ncbi:MAG: XRE family transcriptional regulator [Eggerthellaceae bacterium]|nr:XRE family transcriptional regulator [Eggerthellaceae bacterium]
MIAKRTGIGAPAVSRIVRGLEPPYPKRGRAIADAVGWPDDWRELFEEEGEFEAAGSGGVHGEGDSM